MHKTSIIISHDSLSLQVLLLCDSVVTHQNSVKQNTIMKEISRIRDENENKENRSRLKEMLSTKKPL